MTDERSDSVDPLDPMSQLRDGARRLRPMGTVSSDEIRMRLSPDASMADLDSATDELAGGYFLDEMQDGKWEAVGTAATIEQAQRWATRQDDSCGPDGN